MAWRGETKRENYGDSRLFGHEIGDSESWAAKGDPDHP